MTKCEFCTENIPRSFECFFCGSVFCAEHRNPKNHNCPEIWQVALNTKVSSDAQLGRLSDNYSVEPDERIVTDSMVSPTILAMQRKTKIRWLAICLSIILLTGMSCSIAYPLGHNTGYSEGTQSGYQSGYEQGYSIGVVDGVGRGYDIRDPTSQEALRFIASDQTDQNVYLSGQYTCENFASDLKDNAFWIGFRCGYVIVNFDEGIGHAINVFNTTDRGMIFVEPQNDEIVTLTVGQHYLDRTVVRFIIVW